MSEIKELLKAEENGTLSFGDYELKSKTKLGGFEFQGDVYKVKTFNEITKLERNEMFVYESVPGTAVTNFIEENGGASFTVEGPEDVQITLGLADDTEYAVTIDGVSAGNMQTGLGGKLAISIELDPGKPVDVKIELS